VHFSLALPELEIEGESQDSDSDASEFESDTDSDTDEKCDSELIDSADKWNLFSTTASVVNLPISREGLVPEDFTIPTREEFSTEQ
jgi:hypothetical protein